MQTVFVVFLAVLAIANCDMQCQSPIDLALLLDDSASIEEDNWPIVKEFAKHIVDKLGDVSPQGSHVAVVKYSTDVKVKVKFNTFKGANLNAENIKQSIDNMKQSKGFTFIDKALLATNDEVFTVQAGMRKDNEKVVIIMTDGQQTTFMGDYTALKEASQPLKNKNVRIFVVGVGTNLNQQELDDIATKPSYVYKAAKFEDLNNKVVEFKQMLCKKPKHVDTYCKKPIDLALLLDSSNSISRHDWPKVKLFAETIVDKLDVSSSPQGSQVSIMTYSTKVKVNLKFNTLKGANLTAENIKQSIDGLAHLKGATFMDRALLKAYNEVFTKEAGMREDSNVEKVVIIMTDGKQTIDRGTYTPVKDASQPLKDKNVKIFVVGVGLDLNLQELADMATTPNDVYSAKSFDDLVETVDHIQITPCPTTPTPRPTKNPSTKPGCFRKMDVGIIWDVSRSLGPRGFNKTRKAITELVEKLDVGPKRSHIGVLRYGEFLVPSYHFSDDQNPTVVKKTINKISYDKRQDWTRTSESLTRAGEIFFNPNTTGNRRNVDDVAILFTDGESSDGLKGTNDAYIKDTPLVVVGIAINDPIRPGTGFYNQLLELARNKANNLFTANIDELIDRLDSIIKTACIKA